MSKFWKIGLKCCAFLLLATMGMRAFYAAGNGTPPPQATHQEIDEEDYDAIDLGNDLLEGRRDLQSLSEDELKRVISPLWYVFLDSSASVQRSLDLSLKLNEVPSLGMQYPVSFIPYTSRTSETGAAPARTALSETLIAPENIPAIAEYASLGQKIHNGIINEVCIAASHEIFARTAYQLWDRVWKRYYYNAPEIDRFNLDIATGKNRRYASLVTEDWKLNIFIDFLSRVDSCVAECYSNSWRFSPEEARCGSSYLTACKYMRTERINPHQYWFNLAKTLIEKTKELRQIYRDKCAPWHWSSFGYLYLRPNLK